MAQSKYQKTLNMPLSKLMALSRKDLLAATEMLTREGNKRLTVMKKKGLVSPSTAYIRKHGGKFSTKTRRGGEKSVKELREEFQRVKGFLESQTSTVTGYKVWEKNVSDTLSKQGIDYASLTPTQKRRFWQAYSKIEELDRGNVVKGNGRYNTVINEIYERVKGGLLKRDIDEFSIEVQAKIRGEMKKDFGGVLNLGANEDEDDNNPWKS